MKIALIMESSQAVKNTAIFEVVKKSCQKYGHQAMNYGMYDAGNSNEIKYYQVGILASILIESGAVDFVITGCGTGQGAMMSMNAFPNLVCGFVDSPLDAFLFSQVNAGNSISMRFAQNYGWGANLNIEYCLNALLGQKSGLGYPRELAESQIISRKSFVAMKNDMSLDVYSMLNRLPREIIFKIINYPEFKELFFQFAQEKKMIDYCKNILEGEE